MKDRLVELIEDTLQDWECDVSEKTISEIAEHLFENGVIVLPCKVGDTVWLIRDNNSFFSEPKSDVIIDITIWENDIIFNTKNRMHFNDRFFRENAFFTREEAEQALKKEREHHRYKK